MTPAEAVAMLRRLDAALGRLEGEFDQLSALIEREPNRSIVELEKLLVAPLVAVAAGVVEHLTEETFMLMAKKAWADRALVNAAGGSG